MTHRLLAPSNRSLLARLHREWQAIAQRPSVVRRARGWDLGVPFDSLDDIVAATGFWSGREARLASLEQTRDERAEGVADREARANDVMARLLLAARVDEVAARVALQRLLPGLVGRARRWAHRPAGGAEALDELLAAAWTVIRTFPVERRPGHLVANLLRGAEYHAFVRPNRRRLVHEFVPTHLLERPAAAAAIEPAAELAELVEAARLLSDHDRRLVGLLVEGVPTVDIAVALDVSVRTVRNHRDAIVHRLRQVATDAAVA